MEDLLQNFLRLGMTDIAFLIVNSKNERSQKMFTELDSRVSFPVYQETSEEEVWNVLGGGKDDMFVYDRCSRLVAYIPFPLSILDQSFVTAFILHAYLNNTCDGMPCNEMVNSVSLEDTENQDYTTYYQNITDDINYEQDNLTSRADEIFLEYEVHETWPTNNKTVNLQNNTFPPQKHPSSGNSSHNEMENHYVPQNINTNSIWTNILSEYNAAEANTSTLNILSSSLELNSESKTVVCSNSVNCKTSNLSHANDTNELLDITPPVTTEQTPKRICVIEDEKVCEQWSKRQLQRIQRCCSSKYRISEDGNTNREENTCKSFQNRRCKKLRAVIKCCLKIDVPDEDGENTEEFVPPRKQAADSEEDTARNLVDADKRLNKVP